MCSSGDRRRQRRRSGGHRSGRLAGAAAGRVPSGQGAAVRRHRHGRFPPSCPEFNSDVQGDPPRTRPTHVRAFGGPAGCRRRHVAAQQHCVVECERGSDRGRRRGDPVGDPAGFRAVARTGGDHPAARNWMWPPGPPWSPNASSRRVRRRGWRPQVAAADAPTGLAPERGRRRRRQRAWPRRVWGRQPAPTRGTSAPWPGRRTTHPAMSRCRTRAVNTRLPQATTAARPPRGVQPRRGDDRRRTGAAALVQTPRRSCSGPRPPPRCWPPVASR